MKMKKLETRDEKLEKDGRNLPAVNLRRSHVAASPHVNRIVFHPFLVSSFSSLVSSLASHV
jgi:hypothetical protein